MSDTMACEPNDGLSPHVRLMVRLSEAITLLYVHGVMTEAETAKIRARYKKNFEPEDEGGPGRLLPTHGSGP